jgi:NurA-like 5'-3' nuclease
VAIPDRDIFELLPLAEGERSGLFQSSSAISQQRYGEHKIHYFYLNAGKEIARVEIPEWVALNPEHLELVHSIVFDQCQRGDSYPRSLAEAHEKAVISMSDREMFWRLVDGNLINHHLSTSLSAKERNKKIRGL